MRSAIIIGAGPAGLTAARTLREGGLEDVLVLERNSESGGLPRFCGHAGWGMLDLKRFHTGPTYARRLVERAAGVEIATGMSVLDLRPGGGVTVCGPRGVEMLEAGMVLIATGIRETPRSARLVSGTRPPGVMNTGAFQEMVYAGGMKPFERPIIVGSELVAFSALMTARHAAIRPVAMIEENARITAWRPGDLVAQAVFGVPVWTRTRLKAIRGEDKVESVLLESGGVERELHCDGVIFTGRFVPEASLLRGGPFAFDHDTGGPAIDSHFRLNQPGFFAAGNVLRPVEHSGIAAREGLRAATAMLMARKGRLPDPQSAIQVAISGALAYAMPRRIFPNDGPVTFNARLSRAFRGVLVATQDGRLVHRQALRGLPERRISIALPEGALQPGITLVLEARDET
jgi:thioredoxin reductase